MTQRKSRLMTTPHLLGGPKWWDWGRAGNTRMAIHETDGELPIGRMNRENMEKYTGAQVLSYTFELEIEVAKFLIILP